MSKVLPFLSDPGIKREWIDNEDGTFTVTEKEDLSALLDRNKQIQNNFDGYTPSRDMQYVGTIPATVHAQFLAKGIDLYHPAFEKELIAYLNDSDYRGFRTGSGRIGKKHRHI
jgi:hypothetical protein